MEPLCDSPMLRICHFIVKMHIGMFQTIAFTAKKLAFWKHGLITQILFTKTITHNDVAFLAPSPRPHVHTGAPTIVSLLALDNCCSPMTCDLQNISFYVPPAIITFMCESINRWLKSPTLLDLCLIFVQLVTWRYRIL